jgi:SAM-dependent methyltransferase
MKNERHLSDSPRYGQLWLTDEEEAAGNLYGGIWDLFTDEEYRRFAEWMWYEYYKLHKPLGPCVNGKSVLDAGCGGGAATYTMLKEGAKKATAVDLSGRALAHCERLVREFAPSVSERLETHRASLLELPFADETFDFVYSAGVVHHTEDPDRALRELVRVLKPGGNLWIGLYGSGGLLGNVLIPAARAVNQVVPRAMTQGVLDFLRIPPLRKYEVLDAMYVPYRYEYTAQEAEAWLQSVGLQELYRTDLALHPIYKFTPWLNGEGWLGYRAHKPAAPGKANGAHKGNGAS